MSRIHSLVYKFLLQPEVQKNKNKKKRHEKPMTSELGTQIGCCPFTFNGLECVLSSAQWCSEFGQYSKLCGLPHCPLPQDHLRLQECPRHCAWPAAINTSSAIPFLEPLAAVVQALQPGIPPVDAEMLILESLITVILGTQSWDTQSHKNWQHNRAPW